MTNVGKDIRATTADTATTAEIAQAAFALDAPDGSPANAVFVDASYPAVAGMVSFQFLCGAPS